MGRILVIEEGRVADALGTHDELGASGGLYARLYGLQERGRNPIEEGAKR